MKCTVKHDEWRVANVYIRQVRVVGIVYLTLPIRVPRAAASIIRSESEFEDEHEA